MARRIGPSRPLRTLLTTLLAFGLLVASAHAASSAESLRLAQIPHLPTDAATSEVPDSVMTGTAPPEVRDELRRGQVDLAMRDFSAGGITIAREVILTTDNPLFADGFVAGVADKMATPRIDAGEGVTIWQRIPSNDATTSFDMIVAISGGNAVTYQISGQLGLSEAALREIGSATRARLASTAGAAPAARTGATAGPGSPIVSVAIILVALGLVGLIIREGRTPATSH